MRITAFQPTRCIRSLAATLRNSSRFYLLCALLFACVLPAFAVPPSANVQLVPTIRTVAASLNNPQGLAVDSWGNLYIAVTGSNIVVKMAPNGTVTRVAGGGANPLLSYSGPATSAALINPTGVAVDASGNLYISDSGNNVIREVSSGNMTTVAATLSGGVGVLSNPQGIAVDTAGNLYIADSGNEVVEEIPAASHTTLSIVAGTGTAGGTSGDGGLATSATLHNPEAVAVDGSGNLYIADSYNNVIRVVSGGNINTVAATSGQLFNPAGVAVDVFGNLYIADTSHRLVKEVSGGVLTTVAGNGTNASAGDGGIATLAELNPQTVAVDAAGNLYAADAAGGSIRAVSPINASVTSSAVTFPATAVNSLTGTTMNVYIETTATVGLTSISAPASQGAKQEFTVGTVTGCTLGASNNPFTVCTVPITFKPGYPGQRQVALQVVTSTGSASYGLIGTGTGPNVGFTPGTISTEPTGSALSGAGFVVVDAAGNLYIADTSNNVVRKVTPGGVMSTVAGTGTPGSIGDGGLATAAQLNSPNGLALDAAGNLYIADLSNYAIRKVDVNGYITTVAGALGTQGNNTGDNGAATSATLFDPTGIAVDVYGNLYITDLLKNVVRKVSPNGIIATVAGINGSSSYTGDNGPATSATLKGPYTVAFDAAGNMYIADGRNNVIRKVDTNGVITTYAGTGAVGYTGDGTAATGATLSHPQGVVMDASGNLYISDSDNNAVRKVNAAGIITTVAGGGSNATLTFTGAATGAVLNVPYGLALDASGNLYISDFSNNIVREDAVGTAPTLTFANTKATQQSSDSPQTVTVQNIGNAVLNFSAVAYPLDYPEGTAGTDCTSSTNLSASGVCTLTIDFIPQSGGLLSEQVAVTDNALNVAASQQAVPVSGTGLTAPTTIGLTTSSASVAVNTQLRFTASITSPVLSLTPVGKVAFVATGSGAPITLCAAVSVNASGVAQCLTSVLPQGSYTVSATYSGDKYYLAAAPGTVGQTVTAQVATIGVSSPGPANLNTSVTLTAQLTGTLAPVIPSGTVTFTINGGSLSDCPPVTVTSGGSATCTTSKLVAPSDSISVSYTGDSNFTVAAPGTMTQVINALTPTITVTSPGAANLNTSVTLTAQLAGATLSPVNPTGTVVFKAGGTTITGCSAQPVSATGQATCSTSSLVAPSDSISVLYTSGDSNFVGGASNTMTKTINALTPTIGVSSPGASLVDASVTFTAQLAGAAFTPVVPSGTVNFTANGTTITGCGAKAISASGAATCSTASLIAPSDAISVTYSNDVNFTVAAAGTMTQTVNALTPTLSLTPTPSSSTNVGSSVTFTAQLSGTLTPVLPTGKVAFTINGVANSDCPTVTVSSGGSATCTTASLLAPADVIVATYSNDVNYVVAAPVTVTQNLSKVAAKTVLTASAASVNQTVTLSAQVTPPTGAGIEVLPTGTVTFMQGATTLCSAAAVNPATGLATCNYVFNSYSAGLPLTATYSGDQNFAAGTGGSYSEAVATTGTTTTNVPSANPSTVNQAVTFTATVTPNYTAGTAKPTGTVAFVNTTTSTTLCAAAPLGSNGTATCVYPFTVSGNDNIVATYTTGDSNFSGSVAATVPQGVGDAATSVGLVSSTTTPTVNQTVIFTATINTTGVGTAIPSGTVTFFDGAATLCTRIVAGNGSVPVCAVPLFSAATHPITATYSGDGNFTSNTSTITSEFVTATGTNTALATPSPSPSTVNQPVTFTATVTPTIAPFSGSTAPTGTVAFTYTTATITTPVILCAASNVTTVGLVSTATCTAPLPAVGTYTIAANYTSGDKNFSASNGTTSQTVNQTSVGVVLTPTPAASTVNQSVSFTAVVTPTITGTLPTGTVTFTDTLTSTTLCTQTVSATGTVPACVATFPTAATHTVTATYSGDSNYPTKTSNIVSQIVSKTTTGTAVAAMPASSVVNQSVLFTATVTPSVAPFTGSTNPTGTVAISYTIGAGSPVALCTTPSVSTVGTITTGSCSAPLPTAAAYTISAAYAGDTNFGNSTGTAPQTVNKPTTSTMVSGSPNPSTVNQSVTFTATVVSSSTGATNPTGTMAFSYVLNSGSPVTMCASAPVTAATGVATCTASLPTNGSYTVSAVYGGDQNFITSTGTTNQTVGYAPNTTTVVGPSTAPTVNQPATFKATITPTISGSTNPTGTVTFSYTSTGVTTPVNLCAPVTVSTTASVTTAQCTSALPATGSYTVTATYNGDNNFATSSGTTPETVSKTATGVGLSSVPTASSVNQVVSYTAVINPAYTGTLPTGTVTFTDTLSSTTMCILTVSATGTVPACNYAFPTAATHTVTATYSGDGNFLTFTTSALGIVVSKPTPTTTVSASPSPSTANQTVTFTAIVTPTLAGTNPTGTAAISYTIGGGAPVALCTTGSLATVSTITSASCSAPLPGVGVYTITAVYAGDANFATSTSAGTAQTVNKQSLAVGVTSSQSAPVVNQPVVFTATLTPTITGTILPTGGTVTFTDTSTATTLCSAEPVTAGVVQTCSYAFSTAGTHTISAVYSGDTNYASSTSSLFTQVVTPLATTSVTVSSSLPVSVATQAVTFTALVTPQITGVAVPTGSVTFTSTDASGDKIVTLTATCAAAQVSSISSGANKGSATASCTATFPSTIPVGSSSQTITATYSGDGNFVGSTNALAPAQTVQNFSVANLATATGGTALPAGAASNAIFVTQGSTNLSDPLSPSTVKVVVTSSGGYTDTLNVVCSVTALSASGLSANASVIDPSCKLSAATMPGANGTQTLTYTIAASSQAAVGSYAVAFTATDKSNPALSQITKPLTVYVVAQSASLSLAQGATGTAGSVVFNTATPPSGTAPTTFVSIACTIISPVPTSGGVTCSTTDALPLQVTGLLTTVPITITPSGSVAQLNRTSTIYAAAFLGLPLFALVGWFGSRKSPRKNLFRFLGMIVLLVGLSFTSGCAGGGFTQPPTPTANGIGPGTYVVQVVATDQAGQKYYAVIPLVISAI